MSKKDTMMVTITLSAKQARLLGKLAYWGHSTLTLADPRHGEEWHDALESFFQAGSEAGMSNFSYDRWIDEPPEDVAEFQITADKMNMVRELLYLLSLRDMNREYDERQLEEMEEEEFDRLRQEKFAAYAQLLHEHGFDSLELQVPESKSIYTPGV